MLKKSWAVGSLFALLSLTIAVPVLAQTNTGGCGFWANLFKRCSQSANVLEARFGSTSKENVTEKSQMKLSGTTNPTSAAQIQCVGAAVATREASLGAAMATYGTSLNSAYSTRAADLASAYSKTTVTELRAGISVAWKTFNAGVQAAQKTWRTSKESAWKTFNTAAKACKGSSSVTDSANAVSEMVGQ